MAFGNIRNSLVGLTRFIKNKNGDMVLVPLQIHQINPIASGENLFSYYAQFFFNSADALKEVLLDAGKGFDLGNVPSFLYLHGLELVLKSELYNRDSLGLTTDQFGKRFGHNINELLDELEKQGVDWKRGLTTNEIEFIEKIGHDYQGKLYNYEDGIEQKDHLNVDSIKTSAIVEKIRTNLSNTS